MFLLFPSLIYFPVCFSVFLVPWCLSPYFFLLSLTLIFFCLFSMSYSSSSPIFRLSTLFTQTLLINPTIVNKFQNGVKLYFYSRIIYFLNILLEWGLEGEIPWLFFWGGGRMGHNLTIYFFLVILASWRHRGLLGSIKLSTLSSLYHPNSADSLTRTNTDNTFTDGQTPINTLTQ